MKNCFSEADMDMIRTGYCVIVDSPRCQSPVVLIDLSQTPFYSFHTNSRLVFYLTTTLTDERYQTTGVSILQLVTSAPRPPVDTNPEGWHMFRLALPCRVKQVLVVRAFEPWKEALLDSIAFQVALSAGFKTKVNPNLLVADSVRGLSLELQQRGVDPSRVPAFFGGSYQYQSFAEWIRMRRSVEELVTLPLMGYNHISNNVAMASMRPFVAQGAMANNPNTNIPMIKQKPKQQRGVPPDKHVPIVARKAKMKQPTKRKNPQNVPKLQRKNPPDIVALGIVTLPEQIKAFTVQKRALLEENKRLETLLATARKLIVGEAIPTS
eukprot:scaffold34686_cov160-Amphora_coffeaeformis.AAC.4